MQNKTVLVVDDDKDLCELLSIGLEQRGYSARTVHTIEDAELALRENSFWATLCDVYLGSQDGLELCARATANYPQMSMIMMTGQGDLDVAIRAIRAGAYDFIPKPFRVRELLATDPGSVKDFQAFAKQTGNDLLSQAEANKEFTFFLKRK